MKAILSIGWGMALLLAGGRALAQLPPSGVVPQQVVYQQQPVIAQPVAQQNMPPTNMQPAAAVQQQPTAVQPATLYQPAAPQPVVQQQPVYPQHAPMMPQAVSQPTALQQQPPMTAQYTLSVSADDTVPQQTVIPEQQAPVQVSESTTYYVVSPEMSRTERRQLQQRDFAARIDSLIRSHNYFFRARTMQELPAGREQRVYADFYYCAILADHVEVHLPVEQGAARYIEVLNFDSMTLGEYRAARTQSGWNITFNIGQNDVIYHAEMTVSTATGEVQLTLIAPHVTMRYTGGLQL